MWVRSLDWEDWRRKWQYTRVFGLENPTEKEPGRLQLGEVAKSQTRLAPVT